MRGESQSVEELMLLVLVRLEFLTRTPTVKCCMIAGGVLWS